MLLDASTQQLPSTRQWITMRAKIHSGVAPVGTATGGCRSSGLSGLFGVQREKICG